MTNKQRVLDYLRSISPEAATNSRIREATGIEPHQQVYQLTQKLILEGLIRGEHRGHEWFFWVAESAVVPPTPSGSTVRRPLTPRGFEVLARRVLSGHYGVGLSAGSVAGVRKEFDFVSGDGRIVGDAKYYTLARGTQLPPAKFATIAEHVWLLEETGAPITFLVFGNDQRVPVLWLERYGKLVSGVAFYFLTDDGKLEELVNPDRASLQE